MNRPAAAPPVVVAGIPRSGTSWVAKALSFDPRYTYFREPDNYDRVAGAERRFASLYLAAGMADAAWDAHLDRAIRGRIATRFTLSEEIARRTARLPRWLRPVGRSMPLLLRGRQPVLLKLVNSNLALGRLAERYPAARQLYLVRHPCATFASWRRLGWEPEPRALLDSPALMHDHLEPFRELLHSARSFWERAGAYWGAVNHVVHRQTAAEPGSRVVAVYESLCERGEERFRALHEQLGLAWTDGAADFLRTADRTDDAPYSLRRRARDQVHAWRAAVTDAEAAACRRFAEPFGLPYLPETEGAASPREARPC
jgi:hypothetical protein